MTTETREKLVYDVASAREYLAERGLILGKNTFYRLLNDGTIRSTEYGRQKWISRRELDRHLGLES